MSYQLPPDIESRLALHVASGDYSDVGHVLRSALEALEARDQDLVAIHEGIDAMHEGRIRPLGDFDQEFRARNHIHPDA